MADETAVVVKDRTFQLHGATSTYSFHASQSGDLIHSHFGASSHSPAPPVPQIFDGGWIYGPPEYCGKAQREFPDLGNGDFRQPAIRIRHGDGTVVTAFQYSGYEIVEGKPGIPGLPATFGDATTATTLLIKMVDEIAELECTLSYAVFPANDAIVRSLTIKNNSDKEVMVEAAASFSVDFPSGEREMMGLSGDWGREGQVFRRPIFPGQQGFQSLAGFSSAFHNPFLGVVSPETTETNGEAYGISLVYTGSFSAMVERNSTGLDRVQIGMNPLHLSWPIAPGGTFNSPEAVAVYSAQGLGGMSRSFHRLYRDHLSRSSWTHKDRPVLINHWEATEFDYDGDIIYRVAKAGNDLGCKLAVMDDAWFGIKYPRNSDSAGLGDWQVNEDKLKGSLDHLVQRINSLKGTTGESMGFGLWVEPEHCNPTSEIFEAHPEWTLHTRVNDKVYTRIQQRFQHVLNLGLVEVQDHLIKVIGDAIASTNIVYVKWDSNKAMDQMPTPSTAHSYMLGLYRVLENLTTRFPDILWEGCASGGGRFDPGLLHYFPGSWTSDNTDPADRLYIQSGISLVYPPSSMSGHIASIPSQHSHRNTPLEFRAHVSMMCGSFGLELDPDQLTDDEKAQVKGWIVMSERISPLIVRGDLYRLATPDKSNWPAFMYMSRDGSELVLLAYQLLNRVNNAVPAVRLQGLEPKAKYVIEGEETYTGNTLMNVGLKFPWRGDHDSRILFLSRVSQT